jgi:folate-binding protein YgfZ
MNWQPQLQSLQLTPSTTLPKLTFAPLTSWGAIEVVGEDKKSYLQGQVTCDVVSLEQGDSTLGAHCEAKGKVWSIFRLCHTRRGYAMLQPKSAISAELTEIKKYSVFSKVTIDESSLHVIGVMGDEAQAWIDNHFEGKGSVRQNDDSSAVQIDASRWMLLVADQFITQYIESSEAVVCDEKYWSRYDIEQALPYLAAESQNAHIPQAFNLQALGGISFNKGCYTGQETVARAKYRGINKRMMAIIEGQLPAINTVDEDLELERAVGENWRSAGPILNHFQFDDGHWIANAIIANNLEPDTLLRIKQAPEVQLSITPLPYSLEDE